MLDLVKMLPDGASVVAVLLVIILFLRQADKINVLMVDLAKQFNDRVVDGLKGFQEQILKLADQQSRGQKEYQDQVQAMTKETILALKSLEISLLKRSTLNMDTNIDKDNL